MRLRGGPRGFRGGSEKRERREGGVRVRVRGESGKKDAESMGDVMRGRER